MTAWQRQWQMILLAFEGMRRSPVRAALTALGIAIASGALVSMVAFVLGLQAQVEIPFERLGLFNNIEVSRRGSDSDENDSRRDESSDASPDQATPSPPLDDTAIQKFEAIEGVDYAYPDIRVGMIELQHGETHHKSYAMGLPREATLINVFDELLTAGEYFTLGDDAEIILGEALAKQLGFASPVEAVGQQVTLITSGLETHDTDASQFNFKEERREVTVVGVFKAPGFASNFGQDAALLPVDLMRHLPGSLAESRLSQLRQGENATGGFSRVIVRAVSPGKVADIEKTIREQGFETSAFATRIDEAKTFFVFMKLLLSAVGTVALVVAGLGILNTMLMTVIQRQSEIGLYKAIGASQADIRLLFLTEAGLVGLCGGIGGLVLAGVVSTLIQFGIQWYMARQGITEPVTMFRFPIWLLLSAVGYCMLISIISGLYPATRAARLDPIVALRRE